ncbi:hypothetical protein KRR40_08930 [Niabella defluvii]|nr:hypothetical protein KRR40_08930 [Niabella sp. I65]
MFESSKVPQIKSYAVLDLNFSFRGNISSAIMIINILIAVVITTFIKK